MSVYQMYVCTSRHNNVGMLRNFKCRDREESLRRNKGFGLAKDYKLINKGWDFDLPDIRREFAGKKIHIWQGVKDTVVPFRLQKCVRELIPDVVNLNKLDNHGHFSWFCFDPQAPIEILDTLFADEITTKNKEPTDQPVAK